MIKFISFSSPKLILSVGFLSLSVLFMSCDVTQDYAAQRRLLEQQRDFQLQQDESMFEIKANKMFSSIAPDLTIHLMDNLGRGTSPSHDFSPKNVNCFQSRGIARCNINFFWRNNDKDVIVSGVMTWDERTNSVSFVCTRYENVRPYYSDYIKKLCDGIYVYQGGH